LARLYTRSGDDGRTGLASGERVAKSSARIEALGSVDEANAAIGLARAHLMSEPEPAVLDALLDQAQHRLFDLGADLAGAGPRQRIGPEQAAELERAIDALDGQLPPLQAFVLPGGTPAAAALHLARGVCRGAERAVAALAQAEAPEPGAPESGALMYLNRLSDLLFVAARYANRERGDVLWRGLA
jgi:cob(I)alamin adenosyltransferase